MYVYNLSKATWLKITRKVITLVKFKTICGIKTSIISTLKRK